MEFHRLVLFIFSNSAHSCDNVLIIVTVEFHRRSMNDESSVFLCISKNNTAGHTRILHLIRTHECTYIADTKCRWICIYITRQNNNLLLFNLLQQYDDWIKREIGIILLYSRKPNRIVNCKQR